MINFSKQIEEYRKAKKDALEKIEECFLDAEKSMREGPSRCAYAAELDLSHILYCLGRFTFYLEKDLEEIVPALRKCKEQVLYARENFCRKEFKEALAVLAGAKSIFLEFQIGQEAVLTQILTKHISRIRL